MSSLLPDFLLIGAMKSATTSLHAYLRPHPQVFMPVYKEIDFFSLPENWNKGLDWYRQFFRAAPEGTVKGEASTTYTKYPEYQGVAERIATTLPKAKYIYCVRDPIERMVSHYHHEVARGRERRDVTEALLEDPRYLATSQYGMQLELHLRFVEPQRVLILEMEQLRRDRTASMRSVYGFLGVDTGWTGHGDIPELYATEERLGAVGPFSSFAQSGLTRGIRRRISPHAKRNIRKAFERVRRGRSISELTNALSPELLEVLEARLTADQDRFSELRRLCSR